MCGFVFFFVLFGNGIWNGVISLLEVEKVMDIVFGYFIDFFFLGLKAVEGEVGILVL